ncbi:MAG: CPBP family intramembrane metalloprotease [Lachnospiraceae bacterium]|nr:CPBP family intramembrane metalloprotease [Lachnospiraceae bacterium]
MNGKKANWSFLITILCYMGVIISIALFFPFVADSIFLSNLVCEIVVVAPIFVFMLASKEKPASFLGFHKMKISSVFMTALFTFLSVPVLTLFNLISQIWVENEVAAMLGSQQTRFAVLYLSVGIIAPVFEEIACRGAFYHSYRKSGSAFKAMLLSALIFALVHMNFNQAAYAFVMGIWAVLLMEATGSLWSAIIYHGLINGSQVILMQFALLADTDAARQAAAITTDTLMVMIGGYVILAAVTLPLAWAALVWIGANEGRSEALRRIWSGRKEKKDKMVTVPLVLGLILCFSVMTGIFVWAVNEILTLLLMHVMQGYTSISMLLPT